MAREPQPQKAQQLSLPLIADLELVKNDREPNTKIIKKPKTAKARTKSVSHPIKTSEVTQSVIIDAMLGSYITETNALTLQLQALSKQCEALKSRNDLLKQQNSKLSRQLKTMAVSVSTVLPTHQEAKPKQIPKKIKSLNPKPKLSPKTKAITALTTISIPEVLPKPQVLPEPQTIAPKAVFHQSLSISVSTSVNQNQTRELPAPPPLLFSYGHKKLPKIPLHASITLAPKDNPKTFKRPKNTRKD